MKFFLLIALFISGLAVANNFSDPNEALNYVRSQVSSHEGLDPNNLARFQNAIDVLYALTRAVELDDESLGWVLSYRARGVQQLNLKKHNDGELVDQQQVTLALQDFLAMKSLPNHVTYNNAMFSAGHLSAHLIEDWNLAQDFWTLCAYNNHAGCMNILAGNYFNNTTATPIDISQSLYWHKQVYLSGTDYRCAGIFSAVQITNLLFHFPEQDSKSNWQLWSEKALSLRDELKSQHPKIDCNDEDWIHLNFVTLYKLSRIDVPESLINSVTQAKTYEVRDLYEHIETPDLQKAAGLVLALDDLDTRCPVAKDLLLLAVADKNQIIFKKMDDLIASDTSVGCHFSASLREQLQQDGRWNIDM